MPRGREAGFVGRAISVDVLLSSMTEVSLVLRERASPPAALSEADLDFAFQQSLERGEVQEAFSHFSEHFFPEMTERAFSSPQGLSQRPQLKELVEHVGDLQALVIVFES